MNISAEKKPFLTEKLTLSHLGCNPGGISKENSLVIYDYVLAMNTEINPSNNYRQTTIQLLIQLSKFVSKPFNLMTREDIIGFLDNLRKPESLDPMHKWIGTYNLYNVQLTRFFRWLYSPDIEPDKRQKPKVIENVPWLKRKEKSIYKPDDLWTNEEDLIFLRFCPSRRIKCYHFIVRDTGCRPHELLLDLIQEVLIGCYLTRMIIDCDDLEEELSTDVIEELMQRKEDQNK